MKNDKQVENTELAEWLDAVISRKFGVQYLSCCSISVMLSTSMGKTDNSVGYKESGMREASGTMPSVWGVINYFEACKGLRRKDLGKYIWIRNR